MNLPFNFKIDEQQLATVFQQISSSFGSFFEQNAQGDSSFAKLLSAAQAVQELSGIPVHPYERMKYELFGEGHKFKTIDDISIPENFNLKSLTESLHEVSHQFRDTTLSAASAFATYAESTSGINFDLANMSYDTPQFTSLEIDLAKKNIEFSEVVKSLTVDQIKAQPLEIAQKLVSHFVTLYK